MAKSTWTAQPKYDQDYYKKQACKFLHKEFSKQFKRDTDRYIEYIVRAKPTEKYIKDSLLTTVSDWVGSFHSHYGYTLQVFTDASLQEFTNNTYTYLVAKIKEKQL